MADLKVGSRSAAQRLAVFNHKGGVGKTTLTVNIAAALATMGQRVLLVDSDPQCNLTAYLVEESVLNDLLDRSDKEDGKTVWTALKPLVDASGYISPIQPLERSENIYLLPGDIRLAEFEESLHGFWTDCFQRKPRGYRGTGALSDLVNRVALANRIDFVLYDSGPNIGPLNRAILLDCDQFAIPAACDLFSLRAIKTLGRTLSEWITDWHTVLELAPDEIYLFPGMPRFAGYIPQRFKTYGGEPASGFSHYIARIERAIESDVIAVLPRDSRPTSRLKLGEIKDFASLAAASQREGVPLWEVRKATQNQRSSAYESFAEIARRLIEGVQPAAK